MIKTVTRRGNAVVVNYETEEEAQRHFKCVCAVVAKQDAAGKRRPGKPSALSKLVDTPEEAATLEAALAPKAGSSPVIHPPASLLRLTPFTTERADRLPEDRYAFPGVPLQSSSHKPPTAPPTVRFIDPPAFYPPGRPVQLIEPPDTLADRCAAATKAAGGHGWMG
ncbi:MAG TPA: hypothetical protein VGH53_07890 [Streptosporangiaceae bacterium]|jgi:hypothetical protein